MAVEGTSVSIPAAPPWEYTERDWQFVLADINGEDLADASAVRERRISFRLNRPQQLSFKMDLTHPAVEHLLTQEHCLIKAYKQNTLKMIAETSTIQTVGTDTGEHSIAVNAVETPWIRLAKRLIGQNAEGVYYENIDRGEIVSQALAAINTVSDSSIAMGGVAATQTVTAGPWYFKPLLEAITELSADLYGFDFWFVPVEPTTANNYQTATLHLAPLRGATRPEIIFEYGDGRHNARAYDWLIDLQHRITHAISLPATYPNNLGLDVRHSYDSVTEATYPGMKRREEVVQNDLVDDILRQQLIDEHIRVRKNPRHVFQIQPHIDDGSGRVPVALVDYDVGDIINGRVKDSGILMLDGLVRVYGIDVEVDDQGLEQITLTVIDEN